MSPYAYRDYRKYLLDFVEHTDARGMKSQLASAARCQRSFLSQVLSGSVNMTLEHAIGMAKYIGLSPSETEYFYCLVGLARASLPEAKTYYGEKMNSLRWANEERKEKISSSSGHGEIIPEYYSNWKFAAVQELGPNHSSLPVRAGLSFFPMADL